MAQLGARLDGIEEAVGSNPIGSTNSMKRSAFQLAVAAIIFIVFAHRVLSLPAPPRVVHVFVALADNQHQGIVPVPAKLGDGDDPANNLYWGAAYGVKTFFRKSADWRFVSCAHGPKPAILERCIFRHRAEAVYLVADAYKGAEIRAALTDFLSASTGITQETVAVRIDATDTQLAAGGAANVVAYVGHDGFMDFQIPPIAGDSKKKPRMAIILACASKQYFASYLQHTGAEPLLWTTNLMAPEAYTLKAALDGWIAGEDSGAVRERAAAAYSKYQNCGLRTAEKLFATGW